MHAWSTRMLLLVHSAFILSVVNLLLKGEVGVCAINSHGNYLVDHGIVFLNFCGNPVSFSCKCVKYQIEVHVIWSQHEFCI